MWLDIQLLLLAMVEVRMTEDMIKKEKVMYMVMVSVVEKDMKVMDIKQVDMMDRICRIEYICYHIIEQEKDVMVKLQDTMIQDNFLIVNVKKEQENNWLCLQNAFHE